MHLFSVALPDTGWTALLCAVDEGHYACVEVLIKKKANVAYTTSDGINALTLAIRKKRNSARVGTPSSVKQADVRYYCCLLPPY